jgi:hypothetical protein
MDGGREIAFRFTLFREHVSKERLAAGDRAAREQVREQG